MSDVAEITDLLRRHLLAETVMTEACGCGEGWRDEDFDHTAHLAEVLVEELGVRVRATEPAADGKQQ